MSVKTKERVQNWVALNIVREKGEKKEEKFGKDEVLVLDEDESVVRERVDMEVNVFKSGGIKGLLCR